jgi:hypothetical protein
MTVDDLIAFLRDRLTEDERSARDAGGIAAKIHGRYIPWSEVDESFQGEFVETIAESPRWEAVGRRASSTGKTTGPNEVRTDSDFSVARASEIACAYIARHDPARVLREVEAKRLLITECERILAVRDWEYDDAPQFAEYTLSALALPYSDHPGYQEAWRP